MLYTIIPIEDIFGVDPELAPTTAANTLELDWSGRKLLVSPQPGGGARLIRLISTNPADYLDRRWQPGSLLPAELLGATRPR